MLCVMKLFYLDVSVHVLHCLLLATREGVVLLEHPLKAIHASLQSLELRTFKVSTYKTRTTPTEHEHTLGP